MEVARVLDSHEDQESLQIKGLHYYARVDHHGGVCDEIGETDSELASAASLIILEAARLGDMLGLDDLICVDATDDQKQVLLTPCEGEVDLLIASKKAKADQLLNAIRQNK